MVAGARTNIAIRNGAVRAARPCGNVIDGNNVIYNNAGIAVTSSNNLIIQVQEYLEGANPTLAGDRRGILFIVNTAANATNTTTQLLWASTLSRLYVVDTMTDIAAPLSWTDVGLGSGPNSVIPSIGTSTNRNVVTITVPKRFFRIRAIRP